mgnify:CR=1 FL=1
MLAPARGKPKLDLMDLPRFARQELEMNGLNLTTDLLKGATRPVLEQLRERADKERCACLLLIETEPLKLADESDKVGGAGVERAQRVLRAASLLGCNAAAISIDSPDEDDFVDFAADRFRQIVEVAEKLDMNILISPREGLTAKPERVTELIKKIGGFRVGTLPDFGEAMKTDDPAGYLRKLVPYASVVCATTVELSAPVGRDEPGSDEPSSDEPSSDEPDPDQPNTGEPVQEADAGGPAEAPDLPADPAGNAAEADPSRAAEGVSEEPDAEPGLDAASADDEFDLDEAAGRGGGLESLINAVLSEEGVEEEDEPPVHSPYPLQPLVDAVNAVGFDGSLAVCFVGKGDAVVGTDLSRWALEHAVQHAKG